MRISDWSSDVCSSDLAGHDGAPFGVTYDEDKPSVEYLDPASEWAQLHVGLLKAFPGQMVSLLDWTRDDRKVLFMAWGDRHPGAYYLFDRDQGKHRKRVV